MAEHEQLHGDHVFQHPDHARLDEERLHMEQEREMLAEFLPFRKAPPQPEQD